MAPFAYQTGDPEEQAALYDRFSKDSKVWVTLDTDNPQQKASIIALLEENGVYLAREGKGVHFSTDHRVVALMKPVRLLKPSSERPEVNIIFFRPAGMILQRRYWPPVPLETPRSGPIGNSPPEERQFVLKPIPTRRLVQEAMPMRPRPWLGPTPVLPLHRRGR